jgi:hypothetical protein
MLDDREKKARTTTWWTCYVLDIVTSIRLGRKPVIRDNDFDVPLPEDPGELADIGLQVFVRVIKLCRLLSHIIDQFYSLRSSSHGAIHLNRYNLDLVQWQNDLPASLRIPQYNNVIHSSVYTMHLLFHTAVLLLHRPFLSNTTTRDLSVPIYRSSAFSSSFALARYRADHNYSRSNPFVVHYIFTNAIAHVQSARSNENSVAQAANFGLQECLTAFNEIRGTWTVAGRAMDLLVDTFNFGNVIPLPLSATPISQEEVMTSANTELIQLSQEWQSTSPTQSNRDWDGTFEQTSRTPNFEALFGINELDLL